MALLIRPLQYPFTADQVRNLRAGQFVSVSGLVFTARDRVHKYLFEGGKCPADLKVGAIYHCGPVMLRKEGSWAVCAAGPTTSTREEQYLPRIVKDCGVRVIIGKGSMGRATEAMCRQSGCVYLHTVGGAAQTLSEKVVSVKSVHFIREFGLTEAMWELEIKDFPAIVAIDTRGRNLLRDIQAGSRRVLARLLGDDPFKP